MFNLSREPFFRPLWRRIAVVAVCLAWATFEFAGGAPFWGTLFAGIGLYAVWQLFFVYEPGPGREESGKDQQ